MIVKVMNEINCVIFNIILNLSLVFIIDLIIE